LGGVPVKFFETRDWKILLYRPGYALFEIPSRWWGMKPFKGRIDDLAWKPTADLETQIKVLEELCPRYGITAATAEVREFVAAEYERLAASPFAITTLQQTLLRDKALRLRNGLP